MHFMRKMLLAAAAITLGASGANAAIEAAHPGLHGGAFKYAPVSRYEQTHRRTAKFTPATIQSRRRAANGIFTDADITTSLPAAYSTGYLDAPDGSTWYYTGQMDYTETPLEGGYATEKNLTGYSFTIYDSNYQLVGTLSDTISLAEDETRMGAIELCACVSRKFFNLDSNYEVMVMLAANTSEYVNHYYTKVYSLSTAADATEPIAEFNGYYVDAINAGNDYSDKFYITMFEETYVAQSTIDGTEPVEGEANDVYALHYDIFAPASWQSSTPTNIKSFYLPYDNYEGSNGMPFISAVNNSQVYFGTIMFEKPFFANHNLVIDTDNEDYSVDVTPTPDNSLVITLYTYSPYDGFQQSSVTTIPMEIKDATGSERCSFYELGMLNYQDDLSFGFWNDRTDEPAFVITVEDYLTKTDDSEYNFYAYNLQGEKIATIAENVAGLVDVSDLKGYEHQQGFYKTVDSKEVFQFIDIPSCELQTTIDVEQGENSITSSTDRYPVDGDYQYAVSMAYGETDSNDITRHYIGWFERDGSLNHYDAVPLGNNVAMALPYIKTSALNPYVFNTDSKREYMFLVKTYVTSGSTQTTESLYVVNTKGDLVAKLSGNDTLGYLVNITPLNMQSNPTLWVTYYNDDTDAYTSTFINLPFSKFAAGGDGSAENPYLISTVGDLQEIRTNLNAHYRLARNINAADYDFTPISGTFNGTLDGDGKIITGLHINSDDYYCGLFQSLGESAEVKNIGFIDAAITLNSGNSEAGLIAANATGNSKKAAKITDIHVQGFTVDAADASVEATFGGLVGQLSLYASITESLITGADIDLSNSAIGLVGGIAGNARTSASITNCAFLGTIKAPGSVGGIIASTSTGDETLNNCHVDADITGGNGIGGIIGTSARTPITNCVVEGTLTATTNNKWGYGAKVGGIVGELSEDWSELNPKDDTVINIALKNNLVALTAINVPARPETDEYVGKSATAHRIVGYSIANAQPDGSYTYDEETDDWVFTAGEANPADWGLADNYVVGNLAAIDSSIAAEATSVEGANLDAVTAEWLEAHDFKLGTSADSPWVLTEDRTVPQLYTEQIELSGIRTVTIGSNADQLTRTAEGLTAEGCNITLYNLQGMAVGHGAGSLSTAGVRAGVYVAVAVDASGSKQTAKITIK
jgi:hypothetical protein